jgi:hypothetical protein
MMHRSPLQQTPLTELDTRSQVGVMAQQYLQQVQGTQQVE